MSHSRFDLVTVGHFAIDTISSSRITPPATALGGPPTYVSIAAAKLGAKVSVISKVGEDFPIEYEEWLKTNHVDLSGLQHVANEVTTQFILEYQNYDKRKLRLKARAPQIGTSDVPPSLEAKAIHVAPIANELSTDIIGKLRTHTGTLSLDPQGFTRAFNSDGSMHLKRWIRTKILELIDVYKSSLDEVKMVTGVADLRQAARKIQNHGVKVVVVTRGFEGSILHVNGVLHNVPALRSREVIDPTGAGDAYIGAFLAEYIRGNDPLWCASVGSASASFVVEDVGPRKFGDKQETYERAEQIYQKAT
jgi:sugar/nucleoside kinase (ribokinase family)